MSDHETAAAIGGKAPVRRSLWLTVVLGVLAVAVLAMAPRNWFAPASM